MTFSVAEREGRFLTPQELADLGDKSEVSYGTTIVETRADLPAVRHPGIPEDAESLRLEFPVVSRDSNGWGSLLTVDFSAETMEALAIGESLFRGGEYEKARSVYEKALEADPQSFVLHSRLGDCYLRLNNPTKALELYDKSLTLNPDDFHGHWYRANALCELGRVQPAREAYSRALAMSPHNANILEAVRRRSAKLGVQVRDLVFEPKATARQEGDVYQIYTVDATHWWLYGLCKAVWLAEEGHRRELTGESRHNWTSTEELECLGVLLARYKTRRDAGDSEPEPQLDALLEALEAKLVSAFVFYEFGSRVTPNFTILLPPETQESISRYVAAYVLPLAE
jgi:tetratricopeptide (TPR) repeat protein